MKKLSKIFRLAVTILTGSLIVFTSCKKNNDPDSEVKLRQEGCGCAAEIAFPDIPGETVEIRNEAKNITFKLTKKGDKYILGGDVILTATQVARLKGDTISNARTGINTLANLWPNRTVFYTINSQLPNQSRVTNAIAHWENETNLQFTLRTNQANYIEFVPDSGCSSNYGMIGGRQEISTANGCSTGNLIHEIGHAIGFFHEQARTDRNSYVTVNYSNIEAGKEHNFYTYNTIGIGGFQIGTFDFGSIMLYSSFDFSANSLPTMTRLDGSTFFGQRIGLSEGDIQTYNNMYNRPYMRLERSNYQDQVPIPNGWRNSCDVHIRAYADAAMTIPATLTMPIIYKVTMDWYRTGEPLYSSISERTMLPNENAYYCGREDYDVTFINGQIYESNKVYGFNPLVY